MKYTDEQRNISDIVLTAFAKKKTIRYQAINLYRESSNMRNAISLLRKSQTTIFRIAENVIHIPFYNITLKPLDIFFLSTITI